MAINLTLNDFRGVLGVKNDGDVVMTLDKTGIEKANYGSTIANWFRSVRKVQSNPDENIAIRQALLAAINNSSEGKVLSSADIDSIYATLGMNGAGVVDFYAPLTRRELKNVIDIIDRAIEGDKLVDKAIESLEVRDALDKKVAGGVKAAMNLAPCFNPPENTKSRVAAARRFFGNDFKGRTPVEMEKFVRLNMAVIREQVFDRLYWSDKSLKDFTKEENLNDAQIMVVDEADFVHVDTQKVTDAFKEVVGTLMERFAAGTRITTRLETLAPYHDEVVIKGDD